MGLKLGGCSSRKRFMIVSCPCRCPHRLRRKACACPPLTSLLFNLPNGRRSRHAAPPRSPFALGVICRADDCVHSHVFDECFTVQPRAVADAVVRKPTLRLRVFPPVGATPAHVFLSFKQGPQKTCVGIPVANRKGPARSSRSLRQSSNETSKLTAM